MSITEGTYEQMFGTKTGFHTHPVTHPQWISFPDGDCPVCEPAARKAV
jgi:hypothetical protein